MKKLKIFHNGELLREVYPHATRWQVFKFKVRRLVRHAIRFSLAGGLLYGVYIVGGLLNPVTSYATIDRVVEVETIPPVLERIANCESGGSHLDKNGQVLINATKDIGLYQINVPIWGKKATEMGLNLSVQADNEKFAVYLYKNFGSEPWVHSKKCWNK